MYKGVYGRTSGQRRTMDQDISKYIYSLKQLLEREGAKVVLFGKFENEYVAGQYDGNTGTITIDCPRALDALGTLAHEGGHFMAHKLLGDILPDPIREQRELLADVFGWELLTRIGAADRVISWIQFREGKCNEEHKKPDEQR